MGKILRLVINCLTVVLLISVVFLSATQQVLSSTEQTIPLAYPEAVPATYPKLNFSTYFGGNDGGEDGNGVAVDENSNFYITGRTSSSNLPTQYAFNTTYSGATDAYVSKFTSNGSLLWSTFFGGSDFDVANDISIANDGSCYVMGSTRSSDFPTYNAYNNTLSGNDDVFLAKFSSNGQLLWSSYLGGSEIDWGFSLAVAIDGSCYLTGYTHSSNFPTKNAFDSTFNGGNSDGFVSKFAANGSLLWSSYLGGDGRDRGYSVAVTSDGGCYVAGQTYSSNFPTLYAFDPTPSGSDAFVTKFEANGSLLWSTHLGGTNSEEARGIAVASDDSCFITGYTTSTDFPLLNAFNSTNSGNEDVFVTKFSSEGFLLWSTFLGGSSMDEGYAVSVTIDGCCYVTGVTHSSDFPVLEAYDSSYNDIFDVFVSKFSSEGSLLWSTYLGGSEGSDWGHSVAVTEDGSCFVIGDTSSDDFPTQNAYDNTLGDSSDAFITKFDDSPIPVVTENNRRQRLIRGTSISISLLLVIILNIVIYSKIALPLLRKRKILQILEEYVEQGIHQILQAELCEKTELPETLLEKTLNDNKVQQIHQTISHKEYIYLVELMNFELLVADIEKRISSTGDKKVSEEIRFQTITSSQIELEELKALARKLTKQEIVAKCDGIISILDDMLQEIEFESLLDE